MDTGSERAVIDSLTRLSDVALLGVGAAMVRRLQSTALDASVDDDAVRTRVVLLQRLESAVHAEKLRSIAEVDERKAFQGVAARSTADWVADACGLAKGDARRSVETAGALCRLPNTAAQLAEGAITPGHADAAARGLAELDAQSDLAQRDAGADIDAWQAAVDQADATVASFDQMVADAAVGSDRIALKRRIEAWTATQDPDVRDDRDRRALRKRGVWIEGAADADGLVHGRFALPQAHYAQFNAALHPLARKTGVDDDRTLAQRRADALATMARRLCDSGTLPLVGGQRPHVSVLTTQATRNGEDGAPAAWIDGIGDVSTATAALFECDADTTDVVRDAVERIWDVGQADGDPTPKQRKAVYARDRVCVGCGAWGYLCQIHHIRWRRNGGGTYIDNLVLVCWSCHQGIHTLGWTIEGDPLNGFTITKPPPTRASQAGAAGSDPPDL